MNRKGVWLQTYSGLAYWPLDPRPEDVCIEDIAHALSMICRYGGHAKRFFSVAEHSVLVASILSLEDALTGLLHDATEAYVADVPRPLKELLPGHKNLEEINWRVIAKKFNLPEKLPYSVKMADNAVLLAEQEVLMSPPPLSQEIPGEPANVHITCYSPAQAKAVFLQTFGELIVR